MCAALFGAVAVSNIDNDTNTHEHNNNSERYSDFCANSDGNVTVKTVTFPIEDKHSDVKEAEPAQEEAAQEADEKQSSTTEQAETGQAEAAQADVEQGNVSGDESEQDCDDEVTCSVCGGKMVQDADGCYVCPNNCGTGSSAGDSAIAEAGGVDCPFIAYYTCPCGHMFAIVSGEALYGENGAELLSADQATAKFNEQFEVYQAALNAGADPSELIITPGDEPDVGEVCPLCGSLYEPFVDNYDLESVNE